MSETMKKFTPRDKGIKLVSKPNDFDVFDDDPDVLRAVLSCGHITDPNSLTDCCKTQLDYGQTEFKCPVCEETWPYDEVRKLAKLTLEEQLSFEEKLGTNTVKNLFDFRVCPGCSTFVERLDVSNLCVECPVCTEKTGNSYEFCWNCLREWKGSQNRAERCGNVGCTIDKKLLKDCPMISLTYFENKKVSGSLQLLLSDCARNTDEENTALAGKVSAESERQQGSLKQADVVSNV
ncbi:uncharacterized protein LOC109089129 isoform X3 [Cyprinus carpio]|uniref:Uncharacterized protein LOC109089129 isoform X3 n=1 Tax=Cyprinus carpio TaxID=7962 RepID=A0A9R0AU99_CYPCA|nr:uncharacterized protein LOC109089129 isoform X3 [Cyprinus carpio]